MVHNDVSERGVFVALAARNTYREPEASRVSWRRRKMQNGSYDHVVYPVPVVVAWQRLVGFGTFCGDGDKED